LADRGDFVGITRRINGGTNGLADRIKRWDRAKSALGALGTSRPPSPQPNPASPVAIDPGPPVAAPEGNTMPLAPIIGALLPSIIEAIPKLGKLFGSGSEVSERNVKAAEIAVGIVTEAVGARNAQEAAEMVASDPALAQAARQAVESRWLELSEAGGGGIEGARKYNVEMASAGINALGSPAFIISCLLLLFPLLLCIDVFFINPDRYGDQLRTQVVTGLLAVTGIVGAFWLGSSFGSARKDERRST
jgi:hypothetical protein